MVGKTRLLTLPEAVELKGEPAIRRALSTGELREEQWLVPLNYDPTPGNFPQVRVFAGDLPEHLMSPGRLTREAWDKLIDSGGVDFTLGTVKIVDGRLGTKSIKPVFRRPDVAALQYPAAGAASRRHTPRKRGRAPVKFERVRAEMIAAGGKVALAGWTEEAMKAEFKASRYTCRKALNSLPDV